MIREQDLKFELRHFSDHSQEFGNKNENPWEWEIFGNSGNGNENLWEWKVARLAHLCQCGLTAVYADDFESSSSNDPSFRITTNFIPPNHFGGKQNHDFKTIVHYFGNNLSESFKIISIFSEVFGAHTICAFCVKTIVGIDRIRIGLFAQATITTGAVFSQI